MNISQIVCHDVVFFPGLLQSKTIDSKSGTTITKVDGGFDVATAKGKYFIPGAMVKYAAYAPEVKDGSKNK